MYKQHDFVIFSNFKIEDNVRFQHLKFSLKSMKYFHTNFVWHINIRGKFKKKVSQFINKFISNVCVTFNESKNGWMLDTKNLIENIDCKYLFYWVEDHAITCSEKYIQNILSDINKYNIDYMPTSWWKEGRYDSQYFGVNYIEDKYTKYYKIETDQINLLKNNKLSFYNSLTGIYSKSYFLKIIDVVLNTKTLWPKSYPFDFERPLGEKISLPQNLLIPKIEFCACIDDNHFEGYSSLVKRGLFPNLGEWSSSTHGFYIKWFFRVQKIKIFFIEKILKISP